MNDLRVAIAGAGGRMGLANLRAVAATPGLVLHAAFDRPGATRASWPGSGRSA
jgi:4-hydroxy-tetrahydrodipicolinate reductase